MLPDSEDKNCLRKKTMKITELKNKTVFKTTT